LKGIFGMQRDEVAGGWRKLHDEELHNLYPPPSIDGNEVRGVCKTLGRKEK
jgi:hypothetical protein